MAGPITWQNINGASLADASRTMEVAQRSFSGAFDGLSNIVKQRQALDEANWQTGKENNTNAFRAALLQPATAEAFADPAQVAARQQMLSGFGAQVNMGAALDAQDTRGGALQSRDKATLDYRNAMLDAKEAPIAEAARQAALSGNLAEATRLSQGLRNGSTITQFGLDAVEKAAERNRSAKDQKLQEDLQADNLLTNTAQRAAAAETILTTKEARTAAAEQRVIAAAQLETARKAAVAQAEKQALSDGGNLYASEGIYTGKQSGDLLKLLTDNKIGDTTEERTAILRRFASGKVEIDSPDGKSKISVDIPYAKLKEAALSSKDKLFSWNGGWADTAEDTLKAALQETYTGKDKEGKPVLKSKAAEDLAAFNQAVLNARASPAVVSAAGKKKSLDPVTEVNAVVGTPAASTPVAVPSSIEGKPATATHFAINPSKSGSAVPIPPVEIPPDTQWGKSRVAAQATENAQVGKAQKALVTYVSDGDSATLQRKDGSSLVCRVETIDAPETAKPKQGKPGQSFGEQAKRSLQSLIDKKEVTVTVSLAPTVDPSIPKTPENNYGRALCKIEVAGKNVDAAMLQAGAAWLYRKYGQAPDPVLQAIETKAKADKTGLFADPTAEYPGDFRRRSK